MMDRRYNLNLINISPYCPKECGIANYTKDLISSYAVGDNNMPKVAVIDNYKDHFQYPKNVSFHIQYDNPLSYINAADMINKSDYQFVHIQHEFGLYGGKDGSFLVHLTRNLNKPYIITFHTVLSNPGSHKVNLIHSIASKASAVVVMASEAITRLINIYGIEKSKIHLISHGVPEIPFGGGDEIKKKLGLNQRRIISTFGLISQNKGIEYVIDAIPKIVEKVPDILYLVIGRTHPEIRRHFGEIYREMLIDQTKRNKIEHNVLFVNSYLEFNDLADYLRATDLYITPYLDPEQITSGTLAYALGAGKVCISTPYAYAKEVLSGGRGALVPFRDSNEISDTVIYLLQNKDLSAVYSNKSYQYSREMLWKNVAKKHLELYSGLLK